MNRVFGRCGVQNGFKMWGDVNHGFGLYAMFGVSRRGYVPNMCETLHGAMYWYLNCFAVVDGLLCRRAHKVVC